MTSTPHAPGAAPAPASGWFTTWECHCSTVELERAAVPRVCPGHLAGHVGWQGPEHITREDGRPLELGHRCGGITAPCIPGKTTPYRAAAT
ncbi:hypothetical protein [Cellulosimicrobium cellulans]|uniref:hypothetical protein n=1 Tax=Cellulosimicrobium cellulans TaxID=1710 RepID=UPI00380D93E6